MSEFFKQLIFTGDGRLFISESPEFELELNKRLAWYLECNRSQIYLDYMQEDENRDAELIARACNQDRPKDASEARYLLTQRARFYSIRLSHIKKAIPAIMQGPE